MAATTTAAGMEGFKWGDLSKMLGGFMKKPENQRMIMELVKPMTQRYDPRTGKMVGGVGTGMLDAGSTIVNREEVGKTAAAQAQRDLFYKKQLLELLGQRGGQPQAQAQAVPATGPGSGSGLGWGFGLSSQGQQFPDGSSPRQTEQQRLFSLAQGR
jgi:hypothetical protein